MKFDVSKRSAMRRAVVRSCLRASCLTLALWLWAPQAEAADPADGIIRFDFGPVPAEGCIGPLDATHLSAQGHGFELTVVGSGTEKLQSYNLASYVPSDNLASLCAWRQNPQWHNGVYTDADSFTLCLAGPKGEYLMSIYVGMFSEQESQFELTIGKEGPADVLHAPMPTDDRRGVPFGIHRVIELDGELQITLRKKRHADDGAEERVSLISLELQPSADAAHMAQQALAESRLLLANPFYYRRVESPKWRMLQIIDLTNKARQVLSGSALHRARLLGFRARYWLMADNRSQSSANELLRWTDELAAHHPDDPTVKMYLSSWALAYPNWTHGMVPLPEPLAQKYRSLGQPWRVTLAGATDLPPWAEALATVMLKMNQLTGYWLQNRQRLDGRVGGRLDDDVELMRVFRSQALLYGKNRVTESYRRIANTAWTGGMIRDGYLASYRDVRHSADYVTGTQCPPFVLFYPDQTFLNRARQTADCVKTWITPNARGRYLFKSVYFDGRGFADIAASASDVPRGRADVVTDGFDTPYNIRAVGPALWWLWHERDAELLSLLDKWLTSWQDIASTPWHNRPPGVYAGIVKFSDEQQACLSGTDFLDPQTGSETYDRWQGQWPWLQLALAMYYVSGDAKYLQLIEESFEWLVRYEDQRDRLGRVYDVVRQHCAWIYPHWKAETERGTYESLFPESAPLAATGAVAGWSGTIEHLKAVIAQLSTNVLDHMEYNFAMFTEEVVYTDRMHLRGMEALEGALYGSACGPDFALPLFRATVRTTPQVVGAILITRHDRLAILARNLSAKEQKLTVRPMLLPKGQYVILVYEPANLWEPLSAKRVTIGQKMQSIGLVLPGNAEHLFVIQRSTK